MDHDILEWIEQRTVERRTTRSQVVREALLLAMRELERPAWENDPKRIIVVPNTRFGGWDVIGARQGAMGSTLEDALELLRDEMVTLGDDRDLEKDDEGDESSPSVTAGRNPLVDRSSAHWLSNRSSPHWKSKRDLSHQRGVLVGEQEKVAALVHQWRGKGMTTRVALELEVTERKDRFLFRGKRWPKGTVYQIIDLEIPTEVMDQTTREHLLVRILTVDDGANLLPWDPDQQGAEWCAGVPRGGDPMKLRSVQQYAEDPDREGRSSFLRAAPLVTESSVLTLELEWTLPGRIPAFGPVFVHTIGPMTDDNPPLTS